MTDEQIIKEIKSLIKALKDNNGWWENEGRGGWFNYSILEDALTVIQRLKSEIERLKSQVNRLKKYDEERDIALHARLIATARADAVREVIAYIDERRISYQRNFGTIEGVRKLLDHTKRDMTEGE